MGIHEHFRKEEQHFVDQVLDWKAQVEVYHQPKRTDFLDPREQHIVRMIIGTNGEASVSFFGGNENAERKRAYLFPTYLTPGPEDFGLHVIEVNYQRKFHTVTHSQILGSLMGIGLKRQKYGDIVIEEEVAQIVIAEEIASFVQMNLQLIGRVPVTLKAVPLRTLKEGSSTWIEKNGTIASFRLDAVLSEIFVVSRQKAQALIQGSYVKVNHKIIEKAAYECADGDLLSARGHGRGRILSVEGKTKKDKWKLKYEIQKK